MSGTKKKGLENLGLVSRTYAVAANILEGVDGEKWRERGLSEGDVMFALALIPTFLRINSIEFGLKHILGREMGISVPQKHNLVALWDRLTHE